VNTQVLPEGFSQRVRAFYALTKPRVVSLIVFTAVIGMFLAGHGAAQVLLAGTLGIAFVAGAAASTPGGAEDRRGDDPHQLAPLRGGASAQTLALPRCSAAPDCGSSRASSAHHVAHGGDLHRLRGDHTVLLKRDAANIVIGGASVRCHRCWAGRR
jgi:hypothetical protein